MRWDKQQWYIIKKIKWRDNGLGSRNILMYCTSNVHVQYIRIRTANTQTSIARSVGQSTQVSETVKTIMCRCARLSVHNVHIYTAMVRYARIYTHVHMCVCACVYMRVCICMCVRECMWMYIHACVYTYGCVYTYACVYVYMCVCICMVCIVPKAPFSLGSSRASTRRAATWLTVSCTTHKVIMTEMRK